MQLYLYSYLVRCLVGLGAAHCLRQFASIRRWWTNRRTLFERFAGYAKLDGLTNVHVEVVRSVVGRIFPHPRLFGLFEARRMLHGRRRYEDVVKKAECYYI